MSRIRKILLGFVAVVALVTFVVPWIAPVAPRPLFILVTVLLGPPLLPVRLRYKLLALLALVVVGPLLLHVRPPAGTSSARELATGDSRFFDSGKIAVHYQVAGDARPALVLLHPGQPFGLGSWHEVVPLLAEDARVVAFDRPAAGLTAWPDDGHRERWGGASPYSSEAQADQTVALMDHLGIDRAVLVGSSAGGTIALLAALRHPGRVSGLVLLAPGVYSGVNDGSPRWARALLGTPQGRRVGRLLAQNIGELGPDFHASFWHDPARQEPADRQAIDVTFRVDEWDRAFVELSRTARPLGLPERLEEVGVPVLVVTGDDDQWVPLDQNERLAAAVPDGRLEVIGDCGHLPQQEKPEELVRLLRDFFTASRTEPANVPREE